jgi:hypothetical protein
MNKVPFKINEMKTFLRETKRFQRAGFHDDRHNDFTIYEGAPNELNNAAWEKLLNGLSMYTFSGPSTD